LTDLAPFCRVLLKWQNILVMELIRDASSGLLAIADKADERQKLDVG
jgi:hypothetical protein